MLDLPPINHTTVPANTLTISRAHRIVQQHKHCPVSICPAKAQARSVLIESGRLIPADAPHVGS